MVSLVQNRTLKIIKSIALMCLGAVALVMFFESFKIEPEEQAICHTQGLECLTASIDLEVSKVDTNAIIQLATQKKKEELKDAFFTALAGKKLWGIDISKYQRNINWSLMVRRNKPDFVFVKVSEGTTILDPFYKTHKRNLEKHNILHGGYHFMSFTSSGRSQAYRFIKHAGLKKGNMVPVLDVEYTSRHLPNKRKVISEIRSFCTIIEQYYGVKPIIYTHPHLYAKYLKGNFDNYPLWLCDYKNTPRYNWDIWQHTASARLYGYQGRIDKNVMKSDKNTLSKLVMF
jgi:lysozyme